MDPDQPEQYSPDHYRTPDHPEPQPEPQPDPEPEPELESEPPRRRGRSTGETYRRKNKDPLNRKIEFGPDGNKAGSATGAFGNTLGRIARDHVPINYEDWKKVPSGIKSNCWEKIKEEWPLLPEFKKDVTMKSLGVRWKEHKSNLYRRYILEGSDVDPRARYHIPPHVWDDFVRNCSTPEFLKKSAQGREAAKKNLYPHRLGSGGYASARRKWTPNVVIPPTDPSGTPISQHVDGRSRDYLLARAKRVVDGVAVIDDPAVLEVQRKVEEKIREASEGTFVPQGSNDVLSAALGTPEHPGRTRAHSTDFTRRKDVFGKQKRSRAATSHAGCYSQQDIDSLREEMEAKMNKQREEMNAEWTEKFQRWMESAAVQGNFQQVLRAGDPQAATGSSAAPASLGPPAPEKKRIVKCRLLLPAADSTIEVAFGRAFGTDPGDMCHGVPIGADQRKVQIDVYNEHCGDYKLPIPHPEFRDLREAVGSFVLWPKKLIAFGSGQVSIKNIEYCY